MPFGIRGGNLAPMRSLCALLAMASAVVACGPMLEWRPSDPSKEYPAEKGMASRVDSEPCGADKIGVVHATGHPSQVIEAIAHEAADRGGTSYVVRGNDHSDEFVAHGSSSNFGGTTFTSTRGHVERTEHMWAVVYRGGESCAALRRWSTPSPPPAPRGPDLTQCTHAFDRIQDMTDAWIEAHGGKARDELPSKDRFVEVCSSLPELMQICLNPPYANAHKDQCDEAYSSLGAGRKQSVNRLFVK